MTWIRRAAAFPGGAERLGGFFDVLIVRHVGGELIPSGDKLLDVVLAGLEPAVMKVRAGSVRNAEQDALEAEDHRLMHQLPLVRVRHNAWSRRRRQAWR